MGWASRQRAGRSEPGPKHETGPADDGGANKTIMHSYGLCPRQDSNLRHRLRRAVLYPLSYGGSGLRETTSRGEPDAHQ